jgi:hypothetical protein
MSAQNYPTPTSPLYKVACDYIRAGNNRDYDAFDALLADEFTHQIHPRTMRTEGHEERVNAKQHIERFKQMIGEGGIVEELNVSAVVWQGLLEARWMSALTGHRLPRSTVCRPTSTTPSMLSRARTVSSSRYVPRPFSGLARPVRTRDHMLTQAPVSSLPPLS